MNKQMMYSQPLDTLRQAFKALDPQGTGKVHVGELRYVLTGVAGPAKLTDEEVDEILKDVPIQDNCLEYETFLTSVIIQQQ
jgi:Ca2+-binding EF-hand superfamily protein